ncbi:hypothetical protein [Paenibacillus ihumii]|uniref:hypothetical protein n=1 Tax=Paenibacillus ihumii TaxID=687436 RepID=UPI000B01B04F|nr:hypothetical protein [Paenibacillus ihumii]
MDKMSLLDKQVGKMLMCDKQVMPQDNLMLLQAIRGKWGTEDKLMLLLETQDTLETLET